MLHCYKVTLLHFSVEMMPKTLFIDSEKCTFACDYAYNGNCILGIMNKIYFTLLLLLLPCVSYGAQDDPPFVTQYMDSLYSCKADIDSTDYPAVDARYYRLFAPPTFYHSPAGKGLGFDGASLSGDEVDNAIDKALLELYLKRPDLLENSENRLSASGGVDGNILQPIKQDVKLSENVEPIVDDPVVEPVEVLVTKPNFWEFKGDYALQFLQNYVSDNWYKGGESNYSMLGLATMEANYNNKQKVKWDNKLELKMGFMTSRSDSLHRFKTSEDLIRLTSKLGLQASKKWYYTLQLIAETQFTQGYKSNDPKVYSDFGSPFKLYLSLGMTYNVEWFKKKLTGTINLSPVAYNFRYVGRLALAPSFGLKEGHHTIHDIGSSLTADLTWQIAENIKWKSRLYAFTSYKRAEVEWENTFSFMFNKYISANLFVYPRFDDGVARGRKHGYWQLKEYFSLGFNYSF